MVIDRLYGACDPSEKKKPTKLAPFEDLTESDKERISLIGWWANLYNVHALCKRDLIQNAS